MWNSRTTPMESNVPENEQQKFEKQHNSGHSDSGFLSSGNLQISSELHDHELNIATAPVVPEPMRIDSGVDLDSSENLSQFTLKKVTLNLLTSNKVQVEPTIELTPVNTDKLELKNDVSTLRHESHQSSEKSLSDKSWQFYYTQNDDGDTLLHMAIIQGYIEATFNLIKMAPHSCLLNIQNDDGQTPLHLAVLTQQSKIVRRLILAGANPSLRSFRGNTPLHLACTIGDLASVKALIDPINSIENNYFLAGKKIQILSQDLEQRNYNGQTCLHIAASSDQVELVRFLVHRGADLNAREGLAGRTALHLAMQCRCRSVVAFLLQECRFSLDTKTYRGETAYQLALHIDRQLARELVRLGAIPEPFPESDSNSSDEDESSAIIYIS
ncbi:NF-kappa-B inhibitor cactus [Apis dorsata]|nr:NF-kappa-B inhibitor cactus [Apis dorsata]